MLREPTANQWSDAELNQCIQDADWEVFEKMGRVPASGWDEVQEEITLSANATTFSLTTGTPPTALTYGLEAIRFIEHQGTSGFWTLCQELPVGDEYRYRAVNSVVATGDVPPLYMLRRPNIVFLPVATAARTLKVTYRPTPTALSADATNLNCPDKRVPLVCTRAAILAFAYLGEEEKVFSNSYGTLEDEMYADLVHPQAEGRPLRVKEVEQASNWNA